MATLSIYLVHDVGGYPSLIARTRSPEALAVLRSIVLEEAQARLDACRALDDPALIAGEEADYERLCTLLDALVPYREVGHE
jgi:hypothetical protein